MSVIANIGIDFDYRARSISTRPYIYAHCIFLNRLSLFFIHNLQFTHPSILVRRQMDIYFAMIGNVMGGGEVKEVKKVSMIDNLLLLKPSVISNPLL